MTFQEFGSLAKELKSAYPNPNFLANANALETWHRYLEDLDIRVATAAVRKYISTQKFPPSIAEIRELAVHITVEVPDWGESWAETLRMIHKYGYAQQEEAMCAMTPITRAVVQRLGYQTLCLSDNQVADRANFRTVFNQVCDAELKKTQLPTSVRIGIENLGKLALAGQPAPELPEHKIPDIIAALPDRIAEIRRRGYGKRTVQD